MRGIIYRRHYPNDTRIDDADGRFEVLIANWHRSAERTGKIHGAVTPRKAKSLSHYSNDYFQLDLWLAPRPLSLSP